jgi:hypothetical protein
VKPKGKIPLGRPRHRWKDNIKMDIKEVVFEGVNWIHMVAGSCEHGNEPLGSIKCGEFFE